MTENSLVIVASKFKEVVLWHLDSSIDNCMP